MKGSQFAAIYGPKGWTAWESAAVEMARRGDSVMDWPWVEVPIKKGPLDAVVRVKSDVFAIGEPDDFIRLPLSPERAQEIANMQGALLETPLLTYLTWRTAPIKVTPTPMAPNKGANMDQFLQHSRLIDGQVGGRSGLVAGHKKSVVVGNLYQKGKVLIFGWYYPEPDVFDNKLPMTDPKRQPRQPYSNVHGSWYMDYSHGIRFVHPTIVVNGQAMSLEAVMRDPQYSILVSHEGPLKMTRYPAPNTPAPGAIPGPVAVTNPFGYENYGLIRMIEGALTKKA